MLDFIKELIKINANYRYEKTPTAIREYTIYNGNISLILSFIDNIKSFNDFDNKILKPIFSKGTNRLYALLDFIKDYENSKLKTFLMAQFIVLNQVFGDANHRCAMFVLKEQFSNEEIEIIMNFTEKIHVYDGDLKKNGLWTGANGLLYPNIKKLISFREITLMFI